MQQNNHRRPSNQTGRTPTNRNRTPIKRSSNDNAIRTPRTQHARRRKKKKSILPRAIMVFGSFTAVLALVFLTLGHTGRDLPQSGVIDTDSGSNSNASVTAPTATPESADAFAPVIGSGDASASGNSENTDASSSHTGSLDSTDFAASSSASASSSVATVVPTTAPTPTAAPDLTPLAQIAVAQQMQNDPFMILVSAANPMPTGYVVNEKVADSNTGKTLDTPAADAFIAMKADAATAGVTLQLQSAYRSVSYQEGLFNREIEQWKAQGYSVEEATKRAATVVAPPGSSEHGCGLAADINCPDFWALDEGFENTTAFAWLSNYAEAYGFILRYPRADEGTTGIIYEPWHWRYVGKQNAAIIKDSGLCLEDFLVELAAVANGTSTSNAITGTESFQSAVAAW